MKVELLVFWLIGFGITSLLLLSLLLSGWFIIKAQFRIFKSKQVITIISMKIVLELAAVIALCSSILALSEQSTQFVIWILIAGFVIGFCRFFILTRQFLKLNQRLYDDRNNG